jgi:uncharacterized protein (DUF111 family)
MSDQEKPTNIYLDKVHAVQRVLACARYVIVGVEDHPDGRRTFDAHEVGIKHQDAQQAVLALADRYMQELEAAEAKVEKP